MDNITKPSNSELVKQGLKKRYKKEKRFRFYGQLAITISMLFLAFLLFDISSKSVPAFTSTYINLEINFDKSKLRIGDDPTEQDIFEAKYTKLISQALYAKFPQVKKRKEKRTLRAMISSRAQYDLRQMVIDDKTILGTKQKIWLLADDDIDSFVKGLIDRNLEQKLRRVKDNQVAWIDNLTKNEEIKTSFNLNFFTGGDSREPEQAGIWGALKGSIYMMFITMALSFPIGVMAAIYLEEFAPKNNKWVDIIEVNINNLAAVPSIVFGILGLAIYINLFGMPRSAPLVGGMVLFLMTLPTIIIASRAAIKAVPPSLKEAALGLGASKMQTTFHHTVPLAMPGILTGSIIGMAQALGESAPLLMIGMVAFVADVPAGFLDPSTALPVQIFIWSDSPERAFIALTSAAIVVLLLFLFVMNLLAIILRKKLKINY
jgi:phosphate transport system permease protein